MMANPDFHFETKKALANENLQEALTFMDNGLAARRREAVAKIPEWEALRAEAAAIKDHSLNHLDHYLLEFEKNAKKAGGHVHWAMDGAEATDYILKICEESGAKFVTKSKSMATEEIHLNKALEANNIKVLETDLGEYIVQLRNESPSHIIVPAVHVLVDDMKKLFNEKHTQFDKLREFNNPSDLVREARQILRKQFGHAHIGINGANFLIAETGQAVMVTNEGNGDLTKDTANIHIVLAGIEKIVPSLDDASLMLRLLARSATGQDMSSYTSFTAGAKRSGDGAGPDEWHVILMDNGRSEMLGNELRPMLRCIRCSACLNVCPVYGAIGGHAYGDTYPGPMGSVLTPQFAGLAKFHDLPHASSLCGRCAEVCPVKIPLPGLLREWRFRSQEQKLTAKSQRYGLSIWGFMASHPRFYRSFSAFTNFLLRKMSKIKATNSLKNPPFPLSFLPKSLLANWLFYRDLALPQQKSFLTEWQKQQSHKNKNSFKK